MSLPESTPIDMQIGRMFKVVQTALHDAMDSALKEIGLSVPIYSAMTTLRMKPNSSKADLARSSYVRPQSMTRIVASMSEAGWIERPPHPEHGRILQTRLTDAGLAKLQEADAVIKPIVSDMLDGASASDQLQFLEMLTATEERLGRRR